MYAGSYVCCPPPSPTPDKQSPRLWKIHRPKIPAPLTPHVSDSSPENQDASCGNCVERDPRVFQQVPLTRDVLRVAGVELHDLLGGAVGDVVDAQRLGNDVPGDTLGAGRRRQRAVVLVHVRVLEHGAELAEAEGAGLSVRAGLLDLVEVGEDVLEERRGGAVVDLNEEPEDGVAGARGVYGRGVSGSAILNFLEVRER